MTVYQAQQASTLADTPRPSSAQLRAAAVLAAIAALSVALWLGLAALVVRGARSLVSWVGGLEPAEIYLGLIIPIVFAAVYALFEQAHERENKVYFDVR